MRTARTICLIILFLFYTAVELAVSADQPSLGKIRIGIYDNPPKLFLDSQNDPKGIFPGIIKHIALKEGWQIVFIPVTFKQGLIGLESGDIDIMQDVAFSDERAKKYGFTNETVMVSWGRVYRQKGLPVNTMLDVKNLKIAVMDGGIYSDGPDGIKALMKKFELTPTFIPVESYRQAFEYIDTGKADVAVVNRLFGKLQSSGYNVEPTPILISPISIRFAFSKNNPVTPELIQVIDKHLIELKRDDTSIYYRLIDEYVSDTRKSIPSFFMNILWGLGILSAFFAFLWIFSAVRSKRSQIQLEKTDIALAASENKFKVIFENLQDVYYETTISGIFKTVSPSAEEMLGYPIDELLHCSVDKLYYDINDRKLLLERLMEDGRIRDHEVLCKKKDGSLYWISINADLYYDQKNTPVGMTGIIRDITQRKKNREELKKREERFREMARLLPCGIIEMDRNLKITYLNQAGLDIFGYLKSDIENGLNANNLFYSGNASSGMVPKWARTDVKQDEFSVPVEYQMVKKDGLPFHALWHSQPIWEKDSVCGFRGSISDLSQIKQLQNELLKNQKLESTGMLAGGIAHDFNNILLGLFGNMSLAKAELQPDDPAYILLDEAEKSMTRAKDLTSQLLTFAQGGDPILTAVTIGQVIRETANFNLTGSNIKIRMEQPMELWQVNADRGQISQVISNLVMNARQAMPDGGTLSITMENAGVSDKEKTTLKLERYVKITITDQGTGIDEDLIDKIFDPYFTTKPDGSGLGLSIVHSIILKHKGSIYVNSEPGKGTTFVIYLPAADQKLTEQQPSLPSPEHKADLDLNILLMDDDHLVLDVTTRMLNRLGHTVTCCEDGEQAVALYNKMANAKKPFDLVIMDLTIPGGMGGKTAVKKLLESHPEAMVVVASGYSNDPVLSNYQTYGFKSFIIKPYTVEKIKQIIDTALAA